jgi:mannose-6-phosphate isomerase-like protein (cupin superfamily)
MANKQLYVPAGKGRAYWGADDTYTFLVTGEESGGSYFTMEALVPPGGGPPPHIHHREEEQFYILEGEITFRVGRQTIRATAGDFVHVPRETIHQFRNEGLTQVKMLITYSPAGLEKLFQEAFQPVTDPSLPPPVWTEDDIGRFVAIESKYGLESLFPGDPRL